MYQYDTRYNKERMVTLYTCREVNAAQYTEKTMFNEADMIADFCIKALKMDSLTEEYLFCFCYRTDLKCVGFFEVSHGTVNSSIVSPREIFQKALLLGAANIILVHNHPSGNCAISKDDEKVTKRIKLAGELMGIPLLDHIIIGESYIGKPFVSLKEKGFIE